MKKIKVQNAIGKVLAHDLTKIVPGEFKGAAFKRGHVIKASDIEELKNMGKNHIFILDLNENEVHEDEAAIRMAKAAIGNGICTTKPSEGKVNFKAKYRGLLKINLDALIKINSLDMMTLSTLHNNFLVEEGKTVAATRIIPLVIENEKVKEVERICKESGPVVSIKPVYPLKTGIVVTGSEVYYGRIKDKFGDILRRKIDSYKGEFIGIEYAPDDAKIISEKINKLLDMGAEVVLASGGMSVDADDLTPSAIERVATKVISYGSPVLPGSMFMVAYKEEKVILGIPACGMYHKTTAFDLVFKRVIAKEKLVRKDIVSLAHGGLCMKCEVCHYPICPLGK